MILYPGGPRITGLTKHRSIDGKHKVLTCEAEGSPKPEVQWSVNGTDVSHQHCQTESQPYTQHFRHYCCPKRTLNLVQFYARRKDAQIFLSATV